MTILIIGAMPEEIQPIQNILQGVLHHRIGPVEFYRGKIGAHDVILACSGIGKVHAALTTTLGIEKYKPQCIINIGTVGALQDHLAPCSIILSESFSYHDVDITSFGYVHGQLPNAPADFAASHELFTLFSKVAKELQILHHTGLSISGDQFIDSEKKLSEVKSKFPTALGIDMEGAAIAHVAHIYQIPFIGVRAISDHANEHSTKVFIDHLLSAAETSAQLVLATLAIIPRVLNHENSYS